MKHRIFGLLALPLALLTACGSGGATSESGSAGTAAEYHKITAEEAKQMMEDGEPYILLDVRNQDEYDVGHIEGAVLIPNPELTGRAEAELPDKDARILVYCRTGRRSAEAAHTLVDMGYTQVYDFGGIVDWPYGTVTE